MSKIDHMNGPVRIYTSEEIANFEKTHSEFGISFDVWNFERKWKWLLQSRSCKPSGK
jgi:hypothetical protein